MQLIDAIAARRAEHAAWRREIHAHPELAYNEHRTADFVAAKLESFGIPIVRGLGRTGVVGTLKVGAWVGGFAYSPLLATIFLGVVESAGALVLVAPKSLFGKHQHKIPRRSYLEPDTLPGGTR